LGIPSIFDIQLGYTFQKSQYVQPEKWSDDVEAQSRMFRSPDHYGYLNSSFNITKNLQASLFGTFTGPMLVQHNAYSVDGVEYGDSQTVTESFWDFGAKVSYIFRLTSIINLEVNVGVKNIFDSYQDDLDIGAGRDSAYVYGPSLPRTFFFGVKLYM
jgi:outer membrane receptor for ferrienterochelin and colicins